MIESSYGCRRRARLDASAHQLDGCSLCYDVASTRHTVQAALQHSAREQKDVQSIGSSWEVCTTSWCREAADVTTLPPCPQVAYRQELGDAYGIRFSSLLALNNMPIKRFADWLLRRNQLEEYMQLLVGSFNPAAVSGACARPCQGLHAAGVAGSGGGGCAVMTAAGWHGGRYC
jgi:hypothetical protein